MRRGRDRIRNVADAEEAAYREHVRWQRDQRDRERHRIASEAGYRWAGFNDPAIPYVCPICGASVALSGVELHIAWHEQIEGGKA